jgi:hypothetical protein
MNLRQRRNHVDINNHKASRSFDSALFKSAPPFIEIVNFRLLASDLNQPTLNGRRTDMADRYAAKAVFHRHLL